MKYTVFLDKVQIQDFVITNIDPINEDIIADKPNKDYDSPVTVDAIDNGTAIIKDESTLTTVNNNQSMQSTDNEEYINKKETIAKQKIDIPNNVKQFMGQTSHSNSYTKYLLLTAGVILFKRIF